ncbi:APC family permease [Leucobacter sp. HNU]|uniref:APC family permease n=1 Tax=Leucobacter sp. HNU TaxID=3236805 RepID=UPI003A8002DD
MAQQSSAHLRRTLGLTGLVVFGLSYMAIGTVFTTYGIVNQLTDGHLPLSYVIALVTMLFTAASYAAMVKKFPVAGSAYTYTQQAYGGVAGFMTGWVLLLDYLFIPMINFMILGFYVGTQFPSIPPQVFAFAALVLVLVFNILGIKLVNVFNTAIIAISLATALLFVILAAKAAINDPNAPGLLEPFVPGAEGFSPALSGAAVLALSFLGFDAVSTLSEEAKNARRDIPRAIMLTTLIGGALFIFISWVGALAYHPADWAKIPDDMINAAGVALVSHLGGSLAPLFELIVVIGSIAGCIGSGLAGQVSVARILYSMGRDGTLPKPLGRLSKRFGTPVVAAVTVSVFALACLFLTLDQAAFMISFGALAAFTMVNLSVIRVYLFPRGGAGTRSAKDWILYGVVPAIGVALSIWLWTSLHPTTWVVGGIWALIGFAILAAKTGFFRRPVPRMSFEEETPSTEAIDAYADEHPLDENATR